MTWFDELWDRVRRSDHQPHVLVAPHARLLVAQHGARLLAIEFVDSEGVCGDIGNPFFTAGLTNPDTGQAVVTGGDRCWISPEIAYFWPSMQDARDRPQETTVTPPDVDPGAFNCSESDDRMIRLRNTFSLRDQRDGKRLQGVLDRAFFLIDPPYAALGAATQPDLLICSFGLDHRLSLTRGDRGAVCNTWSILQVPPRGTLICPTVRELSRGQLRSYYDPLHDHVGVDADAVRFLIDGRRRIKMGIAPEETTGRMGYYRRATPRCSTLIVRIFPTFPGEQYPDVPRNAAPDVRTGGDVLQAYNDDGSGFGGHAGSNITFGEMEYHDPAVTAGGRTSGQGQSVTHVLAGPDAAVRFVGERLLGAPIQMLEPSDA